MRIGSLFSGVGGLDMAVQDVFGGEHAWFSEIDPAASKVLAYRFPGVPNLGDITKIDWASVEPVDVLCGGFPCQDVSAAGKRAGIKDGTRSGLWSVFADAIDHLRPRIVVIENVRGLLSATAHRTEEDEQPGDLEPATAAMGNGSGRPVLRAAGAVLGDLADLGYDAQWTTLAASAVGAPHRRERVFIVAADATRPGAGDNVKRLRRLSEQGSDTADPSSNGWDEGRPEPARQQRRFDAAVSGNGHVELLPTPNAEVERGSRSPEGIARRIAKGDKQFSLEDAAVMLAATAGDGHVELLPTPCVVDRLATGEMTLEEWDESRRSQKERGVGSFGPRGDSLGAAVLRVEEGSERPDFSTTKARRGADEPGVALLPTPSASDGTGGGRYSSRGHQSTLPGEVRLLPTPRSSDCFGAGHHGDGGMDLRTTVTLLPTPKAHDGEFGTPRTTGRPIEKSTHLGTIASLEQTSHWGKYAPAIARWEQVTGQPAPPPTEPNKNGNPRLSAAFSEWLMGWPPGWVTDPAIGISRNDQLRCVGNGVVTLQAAAALHYLLAVTA